MDLDHHAARRCGLRDETTLGFYSDGLLPPRSPAGQPRAGDGRRVNRSGLFVFRNLPGLRDAERGSGDADFWAANPPQRDFVLQVSDGAGRFLPWSLAIKLPQRHPLGLALTSPAASPIVIQTGDDLAFLPLYSAASRPLPEGLGVLRTELWDAGRGRARGLGDGARHGRRSAHGRRPRRRRRAVDAAAALPEAGSGARALARLAPRLPARQRRTDHPAVVARDVHRELSPAHAGAPRSRTSSTSSRSRWRRLGRRRRARPHGRAQRCATGASSSSLRARTAAARRRSC